MADNKIMLITEEFTIEDLTKAKAEVEMKLQKCNTCYKRSRCCTVLKFTAELRKIDDLLKIHKAA